MNLELEHQERLAQLLTGHQPQHQAQLQLEQRRAPPEHNGQAQAGHRVLNKYIIHGLKNIQCPALYRAQSPYKLNRLGEHLIDTVIQDLYILTAPGLVSHLMRAELCCELWVEDVVTLKHNPPDK